MNLTKSKYLYYEMNQENKKVYYHALFGNVRLVEENNEQLLDFFEETRSIEELYEQLKITEVVLCQDLVQVKMRFSSS